MYQYSFLIVTSEQFHKLHSNDTALVIPKNLFRWKCDFLTKSSDGTIALNLSTKKQQHLSMCFKALCVRRSSELEISESN